MKEPQEVQIGSLDHHPDNPRLFLREEVIDGIAAQLEDQEYFDFAHALLVRPVDGRYQVVQGHHRLEAARAAGFDSVPCWVREMTDDEAYMLLALGNVQGELSSLEIGIHALGIDGRRGVRGGISGYARQIGQRQQNISLYRQGAEVLVNIKSHTGIRPYVDKAKHLAAVRKASVKLWFMLAEWIVTPNKKDKTPSADQTKKLVSGIRKFKIPILWEHIFLPLDAIVGLYIKGKSPTAKQVRGLVVVVNQIYNTIRSAHKDENLDKERFTYTTKGFYKWLGAGIGGYSWDKSKLDDYLQAVIIQAQEARRPPRPDVQLGEWYEMGRHLLYCGDTSESEFYEEIEEAVFAFADPPYNAEAAEWDEGFEWGHDWLIDKAPIVAVTPGIGSIQTFYKEDTEMPYVWSMATWIDNGMTRGGIGFGNWIYIGIFANEGTSIHRQAQDVIRVTIKPLEEGVKEHKGRKPAELMERLIELFTEEGDTIIDPFLGSGTTLFEAGKAGRICIGGEKNPEFCNDIISQWQNETGQVAERIENE